MRPGCARRVIAAGVWWCVASAWTAAPAHAESAACERVTAAAHTEAVVLRAPRLEVQGAYLPALTDPADPTYDATTRAQARVALVVSPTDMLRARAIERVAASECTRDALVEQIDRTLAVGMQVGEADAARAELAYFEQHRGDLEQLVQDATTRFEHQLATALELDEVRERHAEIQLRIAERRRSLAALEALEDRAGALPDVTALLRAYRGAAVDVERRSGELRRISAWHVELHGGVAAATRMEWFGLIEVGYSLGGPWQRASAARAVAAKAREVVEDPRDAAVRLEHVRRAMQRSLSELRGELALLDDMLARLDADRARLDNAGELADTGRQLRARYTLQRISFGARRAAVVALIEARGRLTGDPL